MNDPVAGADGHACAPADPSAKIAEPFAPGPELIKDPNLVQQLASTSRLAHGDIPNEDLPMGCQ